MEAPGIQSLSPSDLQGVPWFSATSPLHLLSPLPHRLTLSLEPCGGSMGQAGCSPRRHLPTSHPSVRSFHFSLLVYSFSSYFYCIRRRNGKQTDFMSYLLLRCKLPQTFLKPLLNTANPESTESGLSAWPQKCYNCADWLRYKCVSPILAGPYLCWAVHFLGSGQPPFLCPMMLFHEMFSLQLCLISP